MKEKIIKLDVIVKVEDMKNGEYYITAYNNADELIADHPKSQKFINGENAALGHYEAVELSQEERDYILNNEDSYEDGYISRETITLKIEGSKITLAKPIGFSAGAQ